MINNIKEKLSQFEKEVLNTVSLLTKQVSTLEKENQELQQANTLLATEYNNFVKQAEKVDLDNHALIAECKQLYKENKELKAKNMVCGVALLQQQDQFLKVVESVFKIHKPREENSYFVDQSDNEQVNCDCGVVWWEMDGNYTNHLLQGIKSAMEKGKDGR